MDGSIRAFHKSKDLFCQFPDRYSLSISDVDYLPDGVLRLGNLDKTIYGIFDIGKVTDGCKRSRFTSFPDSAWEMMVGMIALADWRGPKVLNGLMMATGGLNERK